MRAIEARIETDHGQPLSQKSCVLPRGQMACHTTSREKVWSGSLVTFGKIVVNRLTRLLRNLEANWSSGLALTNGCPIDRVAVGGHVRDLQCYDIAATKLAVYGQVE